jgi:hypothetical protein
MGTDFAPEIPGAIPHATVDAIHWLRGPWHCVARFWKRFDGFISAKPFERLIEKGKVLSVSFWRNEAAVEGWRNVFEHRR